MVSQFFELIDCLRIDMERWFEKSEKKFELVISPKKETESVKEWINDLKQIRSLFLGEAVLLIL